MTASACGQHSLPPSMILPILPSYQKRSVNINAFPKRPLRHPQGDRLHAFEQSGVAQHFRRLAQQPGSLDVVAKSVGVRANLPLLVEKVMEMQRAGVKNPLFENAG